MRLNVAHLEKLLYTRYSSFKKNELAEILQII